MSGFLNIRTASGQVAARELTNSYTREEIAAVADISTERLDQILAAPMDQVDELLTTNLANLFICWYGLHWQVLKRTGSPQLAKMVLEHPGLEAPLGPYLRAGQWGIAQQMFGRWFDSLEGSRNDID